ncbi:MAG: YceI family protein, partial [Aromatoleum sp.]|nr:YceI family protein [Aromatoleum sp.]
CATDSADGREGCGAEVATRISRSAFGMSYARLLVSDEIELDFAITAFRVRNTGETEMP